MGESKISDGLTFALLKIDTQPSMKLCSLRGVPINQPCTEQLLARARGNVAPNPFCVSLKLTSYGKGSRKEKTSSSLYTLCKGRRPRTFVHIDPFLRLRGKWTLLIQKLFSEWVGIPSHLRESLSLIHI